MAEINLINIVMASFVYSWILMIFFGLIITISYPIFKKTGTESVGAFVPFYNLFELCNVVKYNEKFGLLFLIPGINIIMSMVIAYKLKNIFNKSGSFGLGLALLPGLFMPILAYGTSSTTHEEKEEKEEKEVKQEEPIDINVDSIFKTSIQTKENIENKPYKAKKVQVNEKFINSAPAEQEKIEKVKKN